MSRPNVAVFDSEHARIKSASNDTINVTDIRTASNYDEKIPHPDLANLIETLSLMREEYLPDTQVADSTMLNAVQTLAKLPHDLPAPDLDIDDDGVIEFEWKFGASSFSVYITDSRQTAFAAYQDRSDYSSGAQVIDDVFCSENKKAIRKAQSGALQWQQMIIK